MDHFCQILFGYDVKMGCWIFCCLIDSLEKAINLATETAKTSKGPQKAGRSKLLFNLLNTIFFQVGERNFDTQQYNYLMVELKVYYYVYHLIDRFSFQEQKETSAATLCTYKETEIAGSITLCVAVVPSIAPKSCLQACLKERKKVLYLYNKKLAKEYTLLNPSISDRCKFNPRGFGQWTMDELKQYVWRNSIIRV